MSDIHIEDKDTYNRMFSPVILTDVHEEKRKAGIALLAGDISSKSSQVIKTLAFLAQNYLKVVFTFGNHEYYSHDIGAVEQEIRETTQHLENVHVLQNELVKLNDDTYIWAGTFWTDFNNGNSDSMYFAKNGMNDFRLIRKNGKLLTPLDTVDLHKVAKESLMIAMDQLRSVISNTGKVVKLVVMTHHAPTYKGSDPQFDHSPLNPAFSSNLDAFIVQNSDLIKLWVHGHKHNIVNERIGSARVLCNPMGYRDELGKFGIMVASV
jgi:predicted phosphohydrolase